jgi:hypothetical protein
MTLEFDTGYAQEQSDMPINLTKQKSGLLLKMCLPAIAEKSTQPT